MSARETAFRVLQRINDEGAYSHIALSTALDRSRLSDEDKGLASRLVYGTLTWQRTLDRLLEPHIKRGIRSIDEDVLIVLRMGAYQLVFLDRIPAHAVVDEAVKQVRRIEQKATGFTNAVLRSLSRSEPTVEDAAAPQDKQKKPVRWLGNRYSVPNWLANRLLQEYGGVDRAMIELEALNAPPPIWLHATTPIDAEPHPSVPGAFRAKGFGAKERATVEAGDAIVQDLGAQLICLFCGDVRGLDVLDLCAGIGGKSLNLAMAGAKRVVAVEPQPGKLKLHHENTRRTGVETQVETFEGDAEEYAASTEAVFPVVLVDAPCSSLGVIRRHPETRWTRDPIDIESLAEVQASILDAAATRVSPDGTLVYAVCTTTREETVKQVDAFLERHPDFEHADAPETIDWTPFVDDSGYLNLSPARHDSDGFFAARLKRKTP